MSPFFNVNAPHDPNRILSMIGGYGSADAAEDDMYMNAPRGREAMIDQFRTATGDGNADPFAFMRDREHDAAMMRVHASQNAAGIKQYASLADKQLDIPMQFPGQNVAPEATGRNVSPALAAVRGRSGSMHAAPAGADPDAFVETENYLNSPMPTQSQRVGAIPGGRNVLDSLMRPPPVHPMAKGWFSNTNSADQPITPEYAARYQAADPLGRMPKPRDYVSEAVNDPTDPNHGMDTKLFRDPAFQNLMKKSPDHAKALYEAITQQSYATLQKGQAARQKDRETFNDQMSRELAGNLIVKNGKYVKVVTGKDPMTGETAVRHEELNPGELSWVKKGGYERATGDKLPALPPPAPEGLIPELFTKNFEAFGGDMKKAIAATRVEMLDLEKKNRPNRMGGLADVVGGTLGGITADISNLGTSIANKARLSFGQAEAPYISRAKGDTMFQDLIQQTADESLPDRMLPEEYGATPWQKIQDYLARTARSQGPF